MALGHPLQHDKEQQQTTLNTMRERKLNPARTTGKLKTFPTGVTNWLVGCATVVVLGIILARAVRADACMYCGEMSQQQRPPGVPTNCTCPRYIFPHCRDTSDLKICEYYELTTCKCTNADGSICKWNCWKCRTIEPAACGDS